MTWASPPGVGLGLAYRDGSGVARDPAEAARQFRLASEQDDPYGDYYLALMCEAGLGASQDSAAARRLMTKAFGRGLAEARAWLREHP